MSFISPQERRNRALQSLQRAGVIEKCHMCHAPGSQHRLKSIGGRHFCKDHHEDGLRLEKFAKQERLRAAETERMLNQASWS